MGSVIWVIRLEVIVYHPIQLEAVSCIILPLFSSL